MAYKEKRRFKRHRCSLTVTYSVYASKIIQGTSSLKDASKGGLRLTMKKAPLPETIIAINVALKKLARYVDFNTILFDPEGNPIVRVVYVAKDTKKNQYNVGVRFLERPSTQEPLE